MRPAVTIFACLLLATASLAAERPLASRKRCSGERPCADCGRQRPGARRSRSAGGRRQLSLGPARSRPSSCLTQPSPLPPYPLPGTLGVILQDPISPSALPAARPPAWPLCRWRCAAAGTRLTALPSGALVARVVHKPIPGLNPAMLTWWFNGNGGLGAGCLGVSCWLACSAAAAPHAAACSCTHRLAHTHSSRSHTLTHAQPTVDGDMRHPLDNNVYPRYHVWHPRDHIQQSTLRAGPTSGNATGATWSIVEFFNSALPGGYVAGHDSCDWKDEVRSCAL